MTERETWTKLILFESITFGYPHRVYSFENYVTPRNFFKSFANPIENHN